MSHTIIVGIDGSPNSTCAVHWAIAHARLSDAPIHLVAAYTVPGVNMSAADIVYPHDFDTAIKATVETLAEDTARIVRDAGLEVTTTIAPGDASGVMVESSATADLAVIGARGRGGFVGRLLGSVALAMPAHSHCPTVVIPSSWPQRPLPDLDALIDFPVRCDDSQQLTDRSTGPSPDFSNQVVAGIDPFDTDTPVLHDAVLQSRLYGLPLHLVGITATHILSPEWLPSEVHLEKMYDEAAIQMDLAVTHLKQEFAEVDVRWSVVDAPASEVLVQATHTAELMVVGSRGRGGFMSTLLGSTSQAVLAHSVCPTRIVRVPHRKPQRRGRR